MTNNLIITRADNNVSNISALTHPIIKEKAKEWNVDFKILDETYNIGFIPEGNNPWKNDGHIHYRIFYLKELFKKYKRILCLDSDIVITPSCPNLFNIIPKGKIGTIFEDKGTRKNDRRALINTIQNKYGNVGWNNGYINTGVFLLSKKHKDILSKIHDKYFWTGFGFDDLHIGYQIHKFSMKVYELPHIYNHMTMFSEEWNSNFNRFNANIIHYAGNGVFNNAFSNKYEQIKHDIGVIYG